MKPRIMHEWAARSDEGEEHGHHFHWYTNIVYLGLPGGSFVFIEEAAGASRPLKDRSFLQMEKRK